MGLYLGAACKLNLWPSSDSSTKEALKLFVSVPRSSRLTLDRRAFLQA